MTCNVIGIPCAMPAVVRRDPGIVSCQPESSESEELSTVATPLVTVGMWMSLWITEHMQVRRLRYPQRIGLAVILHEIERVRVCG